jgi:hypothetical protein
MHGMLEEAKHPTLAFVIHRALEKKLKAAGLDLSATQALTALKCVRVVDFKLGDGAIKRAVTGGIFHRSAVFSRRTSALLHLTILSPESNGQQRIILFGSKTGPAAPTLTGRTHRFKPSWRWCMRIAQMATEAFRCETS